MNETVAATECDAIDSREKVRIVDGFPVPIPPTGRDWLTPAEVADAIGTSLQSIYSALSRGSPTTSGKRVNLKSIRRGGKFRIYPEAILQYLRDTGYASKKETRC